MPLLWLKYAVNGGNVPGSKEDNVATVSGNSGPHHGFPGEGCSFDNRIDASRQRGRDHESQCERRKVFSAKDMKIK